VLRSAPAGQRAATEFELVRRVAGFCTAQVLDADLTATPPHIVTEYVPGPTLAELVRRSGPLPGAELERLAVATATALTAIHRAGVVHLDFTPRNVLIGPDGPRVVDFGLARTIGGLSTAAIGTPAFMAPEQLSELPAGTAADVFSWAATLAYAATGRHPFGADAVQSVAYRVLYEQPDLGPRAEFDGPLRAVLTACLAKDPALRPSSHDLLYRIVDRAVPPPSAPTSPDITSRDAVGRPTPRRWPSAALAGALALLLLVAAGLAAWWPDDPGEDPVPPPVTTAAMVVPPPVHTQAARNAARDAFQVIYTYSHLTLDADVTAVEDATTGQARTEIAADLRADAARIRDQKIDQRAVAADSGIVAAGTDRVTVLVVGQVTTTAAGPGYERFGRVLEMSRSGGSWKLDRQWPPTPPSAPEKPSGAWPDDRARVLLASTGIPQTRLRAVAFEDAAPGGGATVLALHPDGSVSRLTLQPSGAGFRVAKTTPLTASG
jgi:hypothetical protein